MGFEPLQYYESASTQNHTEGSHTQHEIRLLVSRKTDSLDAIKKFVDRDLFDYIQLFFTTHSTDTGAQYEATFLSVCLPLNMPTFGDRSQMFVHFSIKVTGYITPCSVCLTSIQKR